MKTFRNKLALVLSLVFTPLVAQDYDKGAAAVRDGDFATVLQEWKPLAAQGNPNAQVGLGILYERGKGVLQDKKEAVNWYRLAAEQGLAEAQIQLGNMFNTGSGVLQNYVEAMTWYRKAAEQGSAVGQHSVSRMYYQGSGVVQDYDESIRWYLLSVDLSEVFEQYKLGRLYRNGVFQDNIISHMWYDIASANDYEKAGGYRDEVAGLMTTEDISKAQSMARECMSSGYTKCGY